jgi:hypothetical protein
MVAQNSATGKIYDITTLASNINWETFLAGQPGRLTFTVEKDPNNLLQLTNGSIIKFTANDNGEEKGIFFGYVFTMGTDGEEKYKITAYDQTRYLKEEEVMVTVNQTASEIFEAVMQRANGQLPQAQEGKFETGRDLQYEARIKAEYKCPKKMHDKVSRYAIIEYGIQQALINEKGEKYTVKETGTSGAEQEVERQRRKFYLIYDDFGTIVFDELERMRTNLVIGDKSLLMDYSYEASIDKDTFNKIEVVKEDKDINKRYRYVTPLDDSERLWGTLKYVEKVENKKEISEAKIKEIAENLLKTKNRETKSMKLAALGDLRMRAGSGFLLRLERLGLEEWMWAEHVIHRFDFDFHTMEMGVFAT